MIFTRERGSLLNCLRVIRCHYFVYQKLLNIKLTWVVRGMMDIFHGHCFISWYLQTQIFKNRIFNDSVLGTKLYIHLKSKYPLSNNSVLHKYNICK